MSNNELKYWQAFSILQPLQCDFDNYNTGKIIAHTKGGTVQEFMLDGFSIENDPEYKKKKDDAQKERIGKRQRALNAKFAKELAEKEISENG